MTQPLAPVVLFAYARPDHLRQTLTALAKAEGARDTTLWVFSDGPRNAETEAKVAQVRAVLQEPGWRGAFRSVAVIESDQNKGLARSIIGGVSRVIAEAGRVIVLEDDVLVSRDFLTFMNGALDFYQEKSEVGSVTAYCPLPHIPDDYFHDVMIIPRSCSQCWATWGDRWERVDWTGQGARRIWQDRTLRQRFVASGSDKINRLRQKIEGKSRTWSILFNLWHALEDRSTIYPVRNMVENIGYDGTGENSRMNDNMHVRIAEPGKPTVFLHPIEPDPRLVRAFYRVYSGPWYLRLYRWFRNWPAPKPLRHGIRSGR